jgi:putative molybdopterin biosynthesis protein
MENKNALTAQDVADILKIAKNTVYEMIKRGEINSYKVGRKVRFTLEDVENYIAKSKSIQPAQQEKMLYAAQTTNLQEISAQTPVESPSQRSYYSRGFVICGQEMMLDVLSNYIQAHPKGGMALRSYIGSYNSLTALYHGEVQVASAHLWDGDTGQYNVPYVRRLLPGIPAIILHLTKRTQGFYVAKGNPKKIKGWADLCREDVTIINREKGAGSRVLLDEHLRLLGRSGREIKGYTRESQSHITVASTVARGGADVAIGHEMVTRQIEGIDFIPMQKESYDLVIKKEDMQNPQIIALIEILRSDGFKEEFLHMTALDIDEMGKVVAEI